MLHTTFFVLITSSVDGASTHGKRTGHELHVPRYSFGYVLHFRHGAEQYMGDQKFILYGYHLDRAISRIQRLYIV